MGKKIYRCPYKCWDSRYPAPKWKTEKWYLAHLEKCPNSPEKIKEKEEIEKRKINEKEKRYKKWEILFNDYIKDINIKKWDKIFYIVKKEQGCYEQRWNRLVKVRYEPIKTYYANGLEFDRFVFHYEWEKEIINIEDYIYCYSKTWQYCNISNLKNTKEYVEEEAKRKTLLNKKYREEASSYR